MAIVEKEYTISSMGPYMVSTGAFVRAISRPQPSNCVKKVQLNIIAKTNKTAEVGSPALLAA